ncbi:sulfotransferase [Aureitalea marina]|uniref:Sulfotransferase domain-containing protein n=1 Tax=Aureitalea marina TaxID=930804 RepID=A0A2S7KNP3_9FLAO|nr:sulfotransferase [Aureitalea marina]PQB04235.1 hypothetical protein BST85_04445 [Aureitalea marina]
MKTRRINRRASKKERYQLRNELGSPSAVIWIFGCQRSGTTFLENIFRHDLNSSVFGEFSPLTIGERKTVLKGRAEVTTLVSDQNAKYVVIRPLFESDRAIELMNFFPNSIGVWMFREGSFVVDSMMRKWKDQFFAISRRVESDEQGHWRLSKSVMEHSLENGELHVAERYARYWIMRNEIPFENKLMADERLLFLDYRKLVQDPGQCIVQILRHAGKFEIWPDFKVDARTNRLYQEPKLEISPESRLRLQVLYKELEVIGKQQFG